MGGLVEGVTNVRQSYPICFKVLKGTLFLCFSLAIADIEHSR
jgi:hypothetical protein